MVLKMLETMFECKNDFCRIEIKRIRNGYLIISTGISDRNRGYQDAAYFSSPYDCWNQFVNLVVAGGGKVEGEIDDVCW